MRRLFPIPLMGQGTADVESLSSYVLRCAYEHGVPARTLISWAFENAEMEGLPSAKLVFGQGSVKTLARVNHYSSSVRSVLGKLTGQDLCCEPLKFLDNQVSGISKEIGGFRWCPECLKEMEEMGIPLYIKQLWHMLALEHCPVHRLPLLEACPSCGAEQGKKEGSYPIGICQSCNEHISTRADKPSPKEFRSSWLCPENDVWDLFFQTSSAESYQVSNKGISDSIDFLLRDCSNRICDAERASLYAYKRRPNKHFSLLSYRRLAYWYGTTLFDFISGNAGASCNLFNSGSFFKLPKHIELSRRPYRNHEKIYSELNRIILESETPPSLSYVASQLGVSVGYLDYRYPLITSSIVKKHNGYKEKIRLSKVSKASSISLQYFYEGALGGRILSRKSAYKKIREETGLPKFLLRKAIRDSFYSVYGKQEDVC